MKKITSLVLLAMSGAFLLASCGEQPASSPQPTGSSTDSASTPAAQQITVKFNTDGGSAIADVKVDKGGKVAKPADPTKDGYTFGKWYEDSIKVTEFDFDTPLSSDITLYASWVAAAPSGSDSGSDSTPVDTNIIYFRESTWWNSATGYPMVSFDGAGVTPDNGKNKPDFDSGALVKASYVKTVQESETAYYNYWSIDLTKHATATTIQLFKCGPHYEGSTPVEGTVEWWDAATTVITLADRGTNNMYDIHEVAKPGDSEWPAYATGVWGTYDGSAPAPTPTPSSDSSTPAVDPSELDDITTKYGLKNTVTGKYLSGCEPMSEKDYQNRDQAKAAGVSFKAGVTFSIVDHENADAVVDAALENTNLTDKISVSNDVYTVLADFTADVYVKTKWQDNKIYIDVK